VTSGVTAVIPTIPPRRALLGRALASVFNQTVQPDAVAVVADNDHAGVWVTRTLGIQMARTEWVAFLDDDDEWLPHHLEALLAHQAASGADLVYSYYESVPRGQDVLGIFGLPFNPGWATVTGTVLVRAELAAQVSLGPPAPIEVERNANDDHRLLHGVLKLGGTVSHLAERTWLYHMDQRAHTSGRPERW
jgi:glycosyltransferase involved in cell wall biosynthesis